MVAYANSLLSFEYMLYGSQNAGGRSAALNYRRGEVVR